MTTAFVGNGDYINCADQLARYTTVVALDGGANHCRRMGVTPDSIIGDRDSMTPATQRFFSAVPTLFEPDQNTTDLQKALRYATAPVDLYCCTSTDRFDHTQAALQALACHRSVRSLFTASSRIECVRKNEQRTIVNQKGKKLSLVPYTAQAKVRLTGVQWSGTFQLNHLTYSGISNTITAHQANIRVFSGKVLLFVEHSFV